MSDYRERLAAALEVNPFISYKEAICHIIRDDIIAGVYAPHYRLVEYKIADAFGTSRTPVKQAFEELEKQGFIYMKASTGAFVAPYDASVFSDLFRVRYILERQACGQACERATPQDLRKLFRYCVEMDKAYQHYGDNESDIAEDNFHRHLIECAHNEYLLKAYSSIELQIQRFRKQVTRNWKAMEAAKLPIENYPFVHIGVEFDKHRTYLFKTQISYEHYLIYQAIYNRSPTAATAAHTFLMSLNNPTQLFL